MTYSMVVKSEGSEVLLEGAGEPVVAQEIVLVALPARTLRTVKDEERLDREGQ